MPVFVRALFSLFIHKYNPVSSAQADHNPEKTGVIGGFYPFETVVSPAVLILKMFHDGRRYVMVIIGNMGIQVPAILVIMGNHFPTSTGRLVVEAGMPVAIALVPVRLAGIRVVMLEVLSDLVWYIMVSFLGKEETSAN